MKDFQSQPITPFIYEIVDSPTDQTTIVDLLVQVFGFISGIIIITVLAGVLVGGLLVGVRKMWPGNILNGAGSDHTRLDLSEVIKTRD